jgi:hypothetical protein
MPWDKPDLSKPAQQGEDFFQVLNWMEDDGRAKALASLRIEKPDDYRWLKNYVERVKKEKPLSLTERHKALTVRRWLARRIEEPEKYYYDDAELETKCVKSALVAAGEKP